MAAMSLLLRAAGSFAARRGWPGWALRSRFPLAGLTDGRSVVFASVRHSSGEKRLFYVTPTRFYDKRFFSLMWFYLCLTGVPVLTFITLVNIFIGEAELADIPEGYYPEHWEYHKHPITRWLVRYVFDPPEKDYEKTLHILQTEYEKMYLRRDTKKARKLMFERGDGPWHYYPTPPTETIDNSYKSSPDN